MNIEKQIVIIKKNGTKENWNPQKIISATNRSAERIAKKWSPEEEKKLISYVIKKIEESGETVFYIDTIHSFVEYALEMVDPKVANQYRSYRNWKQKGLKIFDEMETEENRIRYIGDRSNANKDAKLVATKRSLLYGEYSTKRYEQFFLTDEERQAAKDGYIYIHDKDSRLDTFNCCLCDIGSVMHGGFEMGNQWYNEPNSLDTAFDVLGDIILATAAQQYGGFTVPEVDTIMEPYAKKSYGKYKIEFENIIKEIESEDYIRNNQEEIEKKSSEYAFRKTKRECEQGMQGIEYKLNTVGSSRGDYPEGLFVICSK